MSSDDHSVEGLLRGVRGAAAVAGRGRSTPAPLASKRSTGWSAGSRRSASSGRARRRVASEAAWGRGEARALEGIPFGVKDLFDTEGVRTAYGSPMFDAHVPSRDAEAVAPRPRGRRDPRRQDADARVRLGHHLRQRALGSAHNPWALDRVSGGSSGGSAVVLAAGEVPLDARQRHGRLDPRAGRVLRRRRAEADLRADQRRRRLAARPLARPSGPDGDDARRRGAAARGDRRRRRGRSRDGRRPARRRAGRARARARRARRRHLRRPAARPARRRRPRRLRGDAAHARGGRRARSSRSRCRRPSSILPAFRTIQSAEALDTHRRAGPLSRRGGTSTAPTSSAGSTPRPR